MDGGILNKEGAGEMAQWLKALIVPPEDVGLIPRAHRTDDKGL